MLPNRSSIVDLMATGYRADDWCRSDRRKNLPAMASADDFRLGMQRLASGVSVVTAVTAGGLRCGMTATAVFSLSLHPPSLVVGVNKQSRLGELVNEVTTFGVSVLGVNHRHVAEAFSGKVDGVRGTTRFAYGKWRFSTGGVPILDDAPACFICKVDDVVERSTHLLLIGAVIDVHMAMEDRDLLVYFARRFARLGAGQGRLSGPSGALAPLD